MSDTGTSTGGNPGGIDESESAMPGGAVTGEMGATGEDGDLAGDADLADREHMEDVASSDGEGADQRSSGA
jgi:hypothetical protein